MSHHVSIRFSMLLPTAASLLLLAACTPPANEGTSGVGEPTPAAVEAGAVRVSGDAVTISGPLGTTLAFGTPREPAEAELAKVLGQPEARETNDECGAGLMAFTSYSNGLTLNFQDDKLVGWFLRQANDGPSMATTEGITAGSTREQLDAAYKVVLDGDSTLGAEFSTNKQISGFLTETGGAQSVDSLYAGTNCFFR